ncbi:hypothetical protein [Marinobacterium rhizophilum]|uniref:hypothetical protein n=1 Tax=Marinobacterium rhizophilum TaxID=420402 RepID=UPI000360ED5E|nr:hypothetical protein [Marinobacterium rhizophilum]
MAEKIANTVRYDPQRDAFCCERKWFGIRYQKRFTRADDALLFVRENTASCPALEPYVQQLNDYHYGHWARQLEGGSVLRECSPGAAGTAGAAGADGGVGQAPAWVPLRTGLHVNNP